MSSILRPASIRYECQGCGDCCRLAGVIPLLPDEAKDIEGLEWPDEFKYLKDEKTVVSSRNSKGQKFFRLGIKDDGRECIFLGKDSRCLIHQEFGEDRKPGACKQFPRTRLSLDGQTIEHYSLLCRCVELVTDSDSLLVKSERDADDSHEKEIEISLNLENRKALKWPAFESIWQDVASFFANDDLSIIDAMRCSWKYLAMNLEGDPNLETGAMMREAFRESLPRRISEMPFEDRMDATQRSLFFQLLYYAINPAAADFFEQSTVKQSMARQHRLSVGENFRDEKGSPVVRNEPLACTFPSVRDVLFLNPETEGDGGNLQKKLLLRAFMIAKGPGLRFHQESQDDALSSIHVLLLALPQCIWLAKAFAAHDSRSLATVDDLVNAIRIVDSGVGNVDSAMFKGKMREAWQFLFRETDFAVAAVAEFVK